MSYQDLPTLNALLNTLATVLLILGLRFIKQGNIRAHNRTMWSAFFTSVLFLSSYVTYHTLRQMDTGIGHTEFALGPPWNYFYYALLISHVILAIVIVPMVLMTLYRGHKSKLGTDPVWREKHRKLARRTFPIWLYVSITGVIVYLLLYHLPGATGS